MNSASARTSDDRSQRGFTLLEITLILAVIAILGLVLAPSILNFLNQSRQARATNDVEVLAEAVHEFFIDNGFFPQFADAARSRRIRLLVSPGTVGDAAPGAEDWTLTDPTALDLISNQLINNRPSYGGVGYPLRGTPSGSGWNGPYLGDALESDPWGNRYVINVEFLSVMPGPIEIDGVQEKRAVWAMSAGPDGVFDTLYPSAVQQVLSAAAASPADIAKRIQ